MPTRASRRAAADKAKQEKAAKKAKKGKKGTEKSSAAPTGTAAAEAAAEAAERLGKRTSASKKRKKTFWDNPTVRSIREIAIVVVAALVVSTVLRAFVVQMYYVPSPSMRDTLQVDDRIAVSRISHMTKDYQRGDVIVFNDEVGWLEPIETEESAFQKIGEFVGLLPKNGEQAIVKRIIGVGGDEVECCTDNGKLTVNGVEVTEAYLAPESEGIASAEPFKATVPEGHYWVLGDNRTNSADSRYYQKHGGEPFIAEEAVQGRVWAVIWPQKNWSTVSDRPAFADVPDAGGSAQ